MSTNHFESMASYFLPNTTYANTPNAHTARNGLSLTHCSTVFAQGEGICTGVVFTILGNGCSKSCGCNVGACDGVVATAVPTTDGMDMGVNCGMDTGTDMGEPVGAICAAVPAGMNVCTGPPWLVPSGMGELANAASAPEL